MDERECFVCLRSDGRLLAGICLCRTLVVHKECQQKLVRSKASTVCGICKAPYRNVTVASRQHLRPRVVSMMCLCWLNTCICLSAGIYLSKNIDDPPWTPILVAALYALAVGFGMATFYLVVSRELFKSRVQITVHSHPQSVPDASEV